MKRIGVMQIVDSLAVGGLEQMAVNIANSLPLEHYRSHLCVTRVRGDLEQQLSARVEVLHLSRRSRFDLKAVFKLRTYLLEHDIHILHAHGSSLFFGAIASLLQCDVKLVWHDHFGRFDTEQRADLVYRAAGYVVDGVIGVTEPLARWARDRMHAREVWYVPNFASRAQTNLAVSRDLPGIDGFRVVCVANFRPQKDHVNLLDAFAKVVVAVPEAHLILLGAVVDADYFERINEQIGALQLTNKVTCLGCQSNVHSILRRCEIGILSSVSEGLPLALLDYGAAKLGTIATAVGQCAEVLDHGNAGMLVQPSSPEALAEAVITMLQKKEARDKLATALNERITKQYSVEAGMRKICGIYHAILNRDKAHAQQQYSFSQ